MTTIQRIWRFKERAIQPRATRCRKCGFIAYPPKAACPRCGSREVDDVTLPKRGRILTFTVLKVPLRGFESEVPLIIAIVELGSTRMLTQIVDAKPEEIHAGLEVEAIIDKGAKTLDGAIPYIIKFRPIKEE